MERRNTPRASTTRAGSVGDKLKKSASPILSKATHTDLEVAAWNAKVDRKKAEKKARKSKARESILRPYWFVKLSESEKDNDRS